MNPLPFQEAATAPCGPPRRRLPALALVLALTLGGAARAQPTPPAATPAPAAPPSATPSTATPSTATPGATSGAASARPRIGLALSGGGARGFAHVGVLRVLEQMRVPIDCIAGTSAGAAVGAAYAAGLSPDEIEARLRRVDWGDIFVDEVARTERAYRAKQSDRVPQLGVTLGVDASGLRAAPGLSAGHKVELLLHDLLGVSTELASFDQLGLPFRAVATDLVRGDMVVLDRGSLVRAVRASMSVPSGFAPVREQERLLVDGGLSRNLPVDVVRKLCADVVIAVDVGSPLLREDELQSLIGVAAQMVNILIEDNVRRSLAELNNRDLLITPDLGPLGSADFARGLTGIPAGERAAQLRAPALRALAVSPAEHQTLAEARRGWNRPSERVDQIRIGGTRFVNPVVIEAQMRHQAEGVPLDREALHRDIAALMARGDFSQVNYRIVPEQGSGVLWIQPGERSLGPNYLLLGMGAAVDSKSNTYFNVPVLHTRTWVNALGGEWTSLLQVGRTQRLLTQLMQPLSPDGRVYVMPRLSIESRPLSLFMNDTRVTDYAVRNDQAELMVGAQGTLFDARIGLVAGRRSNSTQVGLPILLEERYRHGGVAARLSMDQLDSVDFPRSGWALDSGAYLARPMLGGEVRYTRLEAHALGAFSFGPHTVNLLGRVGASPGGELPALDAFTLGGFLNLSGLQINQLLGSSMQYARLMYYNRVMPLPRPFGTGLYLGASLEAGRMEKPYVPFTEPRWHTGASVFMGASTGLGPVYVGLGFGERGRSTLYLYLGRP